MYNKNLAFNILYSENSTLSKVSKKDNTRYAGFIFTNGS